ncbi:cyclic nucleotide-binding domain protein (macronuclear) [Tetrahymena thermophila SB210]|uniref:Cyclic nucleotide-binding domain protein n=1 Tax=Tetrahymena thermophila (strain SB210) TaxID=312017 RepID=Q235X9_TETTS|nr:cyclic nucleotide-binding domain protein [Tetrahymena thermophila SB210]EAR92621.2 cyclic nucleotide-binding domain protein [Tetrahymena thermophila SB210]|eukprot:XP_001012866.2 cyclic nucleotide-binding domain protein [Tetrahymena thermophila SB210]
MTELRQQTSFEMENLEAQFNLVDQVDDIKEIEQNNNKLIKSLNRFKRQSCIFVDSNQKDINQKYNQLLNKEYVDLTNELDSSAVIHILMKQEKNKQEQNFIKNAIQGLQLFKEHKNLLTAQGFGNHLLTQMKVEFHEKNNVIFHYGEYGNKYYILLKGKLDLMMPKSECIEENNLRMEKGLPSIPYFQEYKNTPEELPDETFEQYMERIYPRLGHIKTFLPGEAFGEIALMTNQQRTGSIIAREDSYTLVITKSAFHELLGKFHEFMQMQKLIFLQQFFFLKQIPSSKLLSIIQLMKIFTFQRNNVIYNQNQSISGIYFIKEGEVQISTKITQIDEENQDESQKLKIRFRNIKKSEKVIIKATNSFFGEEEIILGQHSRNSKAICISETCQVFLLSRDILQTYGKLYDIVKKLKQNYDLKLKWEEQRTQNIQNVQKQNEENINTLNQNKVKEINLSKYILESSLPKGRVNQSGIPIYTNGSDDQLENNASSQMEGQGMSMSSKKYRKLSYNMEIQTMSSPKNQNKLELNNNFLQVQNQERDNNFHIQNGFSSQSSSLKRQQPYLSPQPSQMKTQNQTMTPETNYTGRKSFQSNIFKKQGSKEDILESYNGFGDNIKEKNKLQKSPSFNYQFKQRNPNQDIQLNLQTNNQQNSNTSSQLSIQSFQNTYAFGNPSSNNKIQSSTNNSRETSAERLFFDSSHNEFESMLKKQTQLKQEILKQISKSKNPTLDGLTEINKQRIDFKIRKQNNQFLPTTPKTMRNSQSQSLNYIQSSSKISQAKSQTFIPLDAQGMNDNIFSLNSESKNSINSNNGVQQYASFSYFPPNGSNTNITDRVVVVPASMANQKMQLNFFSTKVQGNDQLQLPSLSQQQQQQLQQQQTLEKPIQLHNQPSIQINNNQPTLYQLDTLLEEDDENSPLKFGKKLRIQMASQQNMTENGSHPASQLNFNYNQNEKDLELQKNAQILCKKFQLGKKVVKYIQNRKFYNEKLVIDLEKQMKIPSNSNTFNQFDEFINQKNSSQVSPLNNLVDQNPQKEVIIQVKVHKRGGSIIQPPTQQIQHHNVQQPIQSNAQNQLLQQDEKQSHRRRFTYDANFHRVQVKKDQLNQQQQNQNNS